MAAVLLASTVIAAYGGHATRLFVAVGFPAVALVAAKVTFDVADPCPADTDECQIVVGYGIVVLSLVIAAEAGVLLGSLAGHARARKQSAAPSQPSNRSPE